MLCLSILGSNPLGLGTFLYGLSMFSLRRVDSLDYLYSSHIPKAYIWEKDEGMTLNSLLA